MRDIKDIHEDYWKTLQLNLDWVKFSDQKAGVIMSVYGIILTLIYSNSTSISTAIASSNFQIFIVVLICICSTISIVLSFLCLNPQLKNENPQSMIYFGHIATKNSKYEDYIIHSKSIVEDEIKIAEQIAEQIFVNSTVAWKKFQNVTWSFRFFFISLIRILFSLILYFIQ